MSPRRSVVAEDGSRYRVSDRPPWSPAQLVAVAVGIILVVIGGVALARGGINFSDIASTHSTVAGFGYTCLSALVQLVVGVIIIGGGVFPGAAKGTMAFFGVVLLAFGLIVAIDSTPFVNNWGYSRSTGVLYAILGAVLLVAAAVSPVFYLDPAHPVPDLEHGHPGGRPVPGRPVPGRPVPGPVDRTGR